MGVSYSQGVTKGIVKTITLKNQYTCLPGTKHIVTGQHIVDYYAYLTIRVTVDAYECGLYSDPTSSLYGSPFYNGEVRSSTKCVTE